MVNNKKIKNEKALLFIIIVIAIHSLLDPQFLVLPVNIFLLLLSKVIFDEKMENIGEE